MRNHKYLETKSLIYGAWSLALDLLKIGVPAFLLLFGIFWLGHANPQQGLLTGLVMLVAPSILAGLITVRHLRARRRIFTFSTGNIRASIFAALWGAAWAVPFTVGIALKEASITPLNEYILAPLVWGVVCFLGAALPVGRS